MAESQIIELDIPPGFKRNVSIAAARGRYIGGDKIRFKNGKPEKIGGYVRYLATAFLGIARGMMSWVSEGLVSYLAVGTAIKAYAVIDSLDDITPLRTSGAALANDPFAVVISSTTVTATHVAHGLEVGAHVHFSGATAGGGITISGEYTVVSVPTANTYTFVHSVAATSTDSTTGGAAVAYEYEINPGLADSAVGLGYGVGPFGAGTYGTARTVGGVTLELRTWFFDNYGNQALGGLLFGQPSGGTIYYWDEPMAAARFVALSGAPSAMRASFVTNERMVVALGTDTPMTMEWSDRTDPTDWTPTLANTANIRTLQEGSRLIAGTRFNDVNFIWSDKAAYLMQFIGSSDEIYDTPVVGKDCGLAGPQAFEVLPTMIAWFSNRMDFYIYAGGLVQKAPNWDEIRGYIIARMDRTRLDKMNVGHTPDWSELWGHYVSIDSSDGEPDEYFKVNYDDWIWDFGTEFDEGRTGHVHFDAPGGSVIMAGADSYLYQHETGVDANGAALPYSIETGPTALFKDRDTDLNGYIPDFERITGTVILRIRTQEWPMSAAFLGDYSFTLTPTTDRQGMSIGARYARWSLSGDNIGDDMRLGAPLIDVGRGGPTR